MQGLTAVQPGFDDFQGLHLVRIQATAPRQTTWNSASTVESPSFRAATLVVGGVGPARMPRDNLSGISLPISRHAWRRLTEDKAIGAVAHAAVSFAPGTARISRDPLIRTDAADHSSARPCSGKCDRLVSHMDMKRNSKDR